MTPEILTAVIMYIVLIVLYTMLSRRSYETIYHTYTPHDCPR